MPPTNADATPAFAPQSRLVPLLLLLAGIFFLDAGFFLLFPPLFLPGLLGSPLYRVFFYAAIPSLLLGMPLLSLGLSLWNQNRPLPPFSFFWKLFLFVALLLLLLPPFIWPTLLRSSLYLSVLSWAGLGLLVALPLFTLLFSLWRQQPLSRSLLFCLFVLAIEFFALGLLVTLIVPFFWTELLERPFYPTLLTASLPGLLLGPPLLSLSLSLLTRRPLQRVFLVLRLTLALEIFLGGLFWIGWDAYKLYQVGWLAFRDLALFPFDFPSFFLGPLLLALGLTLLTRSTWRDTLGVALVTCAYQSLLALIFFLLYHYLGPRLVPFPFKPLSPVIVQIIGLSFLDSALVLGLLGTILLRPLFRLRVHLLFTGPLWLPLFAIWFFWSLLVDTTLHFLEEYLDLDGQHSPWLRALLWGLPSLILFPLLITLDFLSGIVRILGESLLLRLFPPEEHSSNHLPSPSPSFSPRLIYAVGLLLLFSLPLWGLPALFYWLGRMFLYDTIILGVSGRSPRKSVRSLPPPS